MLRKRNVLGFGLAIALAVSTQASAATISVFSNDFSGWQTAAGASVLEDFSDATLASGFDITFGTSLPGSISGGEYHDRADETASAPLFEFSTGVTAFGADWDLAQPGGAGVGITLFLTFADTTTQTVSVEIPNSFSYDFFGIVSDTTISSIALLEGTQENGVETFDMDNARFVEYVEPTTTGGNEPPPPSAVSEPATLAMLGFGLAGLGFIRRRRAA